MWPAAQPPAGPQGIRDAGLMWPRDMDIQVRHSEQHTFRCIIGVPNPTVACSPTATARASCCICMPTWGRKRHGVVLLYGEEITGVAYTGDASEGVWLVRAMCAVVSSLMVVLAA